MAAITAICRFATEVEAQGCEQVHLAPLFWGVEGARSWSGFGHPFIVTFGGRAKAFFEYFPLKVIPNGAVNKV